MYQNIDENILKDRAILVGISKKGSDENKEVLSSYESIDELSELAQSSNIEVCGKLIQNKSSYDSAFLIGKGKLEEILELSIKLDITLVIFDMELTGSQLKNISEFLKIKVIDRTMLVLDIFAKRAISKEGMLQVELAQQKYRYSRLSGIGTELSRQAGGIGSRGPGEKKLETDRRHIRDRIKHIEKKLISIEEQRKIKRKSRIKNNLPIVALVGYTNSGKSTLFNEIIKTHPEYNSNKDVLVENKPFASLDVQLRKAKTTSNTEFLITDTVGFISNIPHELIDAFKATLEEVEYADILIHVIDISNKNFRQQINTTNKILSDLDLEKKPMIYAFNKLDLVQDNEFYYPKKPYILISALKKYNLKQVYSEIDKLLNDTLLNLKLLIPYEDSKLINTLHINYNFNEKYKENGIEVFIKIRKKDFNIVKTYIVSEGL